MGEAEVARGATKFINESDFGGMFLGVEMETGKWCVCILSALDDVLAQRVGETVEVTVRRAGGFVFADEVVMAPRCTCSRAGMEKERELVIIPCCLVVDNVLGEEPKLAGNFIEAKVSFGEFELEALVDILIEMVEELFLGVGEARIDAIF